jgi:hypothetical protein
VRRRRALAATATAILLSFAFGGTPASAAPVEPMTPERAAAFATKPCDPNGTTALDSQLASRLNPKLNGKLKGALTVYRMSCARRIVQTVMSRGLLKRAAAIAVTTAIVESTIENISEEVDHDSLGLFQQRASWGTAAQRLDPAWATNAFLNKMLSLYPNNSYNNTANSIGEICQAVQVSGVPSAYQPQASDGSTIAYNIWTSLAAPHPGTDTVGMWDPDDHSFHLAGTNAGGASRWAFQYGAQGDLPVIGDWNGDGKDSVGIFRPDVAEFHLSNDLDGVGASNFAFKYGQTGDIPVAGDWDGDGKDTVGVWRPGVAEFHLSDTLVNGPSDYAFKYGEVGDLPVVGDWDGDGKDSIGIYRPGKHEFHLSDDLAAGASDYAFAYGTDGDIPVVGDWDNNGTSTVGVYRGNVHSFFLRNANSGGNANIQFESGKAGQTPLSGDWDGQ